VQIGVVETIEEGVWIGASCICGMGCRPSASVFADDPEYRQHDPALAEGPCCCGRFFVTGPNVEDTARTMSDRFKEVGSAPDGHRLETRRVEVPWGSVDVVIGYLPDDQPT